ncbi:bifunctional (p)ppGpp synthetase/guanosine-3',5'-bis(diphosphate) 3'-pyrophosphohydrolase [Roseospira marina]|uniref:GTP pyrophosphokinase rsh n=1 Tax=Roseospira marina TaxID=140057 RepID=A0A5M6I8L2_9PROT|nr:bifunctional (p)ppGpp synthetase/guanosine-3',5'-bis(diphosphate) 3'-pyrophosphohydrolase [Roseospira marina]KAA5604594.1 bifunctional (p)ppGpp synthetase/guanosine-3',5'-bis(diphosphate) 3'-pyrophosphohydrolase [Roseospira marina]MBB4315345.1 GTP pyrophosphokinase [Roseospira marina]MBB5088344.1 GTP pyrophosphokinase [Roseospira marina]
MMRQVELVERVAAYDPNADEGILNKAYVYAVKMHGSQLRASGDPYFSHPVEVAGILTNYKLDSASIVTALLHDVVEDTDASLDDIKRNFGAEVATLVDGVTKLAKIKLAPSGSTREAENFRRLVLAMSNDIRVLLVKLADRLHNMRTLHFIKKPEKRQRIALETMEIYAPLAERIGMHEIKDELQDLAFKQIHPDARDSILARLEYLRSHGGELVPVIVDELRQVISEQGLQAQIAGREKSAYSIWKKMRDKDVGFEQLADIMAFRVMVESLEDCYRALGVIHAHYRMVPDRFKDYISTPKANGYQSIHTAVLGPRNQRIEVQIRTHDMHEVAERGVAAHWSYKQGRHEPLDGTQYRWLRELIEILEHTSSPDEFLEHTKLAMYQDQVFCFTPKGDVINLPAGGTPVDFAYAVHTDVGNKCAGAKVNGRLVPLRHVLNNGDQVEIATSKTQTPSPDWEHFVVSGKARAQIRRFIRLKQREQYQDLGRQMLVKEFSRAGETYTEKGLEGVLGRFRAPTLEDLCAEVGAGTIAARDVVTAVYPGIKTAPRLPRVLPTLGKGWTRSKPDRDAIPIKGLIPGMAIHYARCCHPLPGDRIVGIVHTGRGVTIHTIDCDQLEQFQDTPERWLDLSWDEDATVNAHTGRLSVVVGNHQGSLAELTTVIAKNLGNISNLKITGRTADFFDMIIDVEVRDVRHLTNIIAALRASNAVNSVERSRR